MITCNLTSFGVSIPCSITVEYVIYRHSPSKHWSVGFDCIANDKNIPIEPIDIPYVEGVDPIKSAYDELKKQEYIDSPVNA